jgi:hypothetical protein
MNLSRSICLLEIRSAPFAALIVSASEQTERRIPHDRL